MLVPCDTVNQVPFSTVAFHVSVPLPMFTTPKVCAAGDRPPSTPPKYNALWPTSSTGPAFVVTRRAATVIGDPEDGVMTICPVKPPAPNAAVLNPTCACDGKDTRAVPDAGVTVNQLPPFDVLAAAVQSSDPELTPMLRDCPG